MVRGVLQEQCSPVLQSTSRSDMGYNHILYVKDSLFPLARGGFILPILTFHWVLVCV
jgi:hypothetical protein